MILLGTERGRIVEKTFTVETFMKSIKANESTIWNTLTAQKKTDYIRGAYVQNVGQSFVPTDEWKNVSQEIENWLSGKFAPKNWLLLSGSVGTGKTVWAKSICFVYRELNFINYGKSKGFYETTANKMSDMARLDEDNFRHFCIAPRMFIDDIGTEPEQINVFGTKRNPITDLLLIRYEQKLPTIITTNLTPKQLAERYGERVADRMRGQSVLIPFTAESFRK